LELAGETTQTALPARSRPGTHTHNSREHSGHDLVWCCQTWQLFLVVLLCLNKLLQGT
jgi:hypothetical protein